MDTKKFIEQLEAVAEGQKNKIVHTGEVNISIMASECAKKMRELHEKEIELDRREKGAAVVDEDGITFSCPVCYADNSKWIDWSMLQRQPKRAKRCQECGTKLIWETRGYEGECYDCGCLVHEESEWCRKSFIERLEKLEELEVTL